MLGIWAEFGSFWGWFGATRIPVPRPFGLSTLQLTPFGGSHCPLHCSWGTCGALLAYRCTLHGTPLCVTPHVGGWPSNGGGEPYIRTRFDSSRQLVSCSRTITRSSCRCTGGPSTWSGTRPAGWSARAEGRPRRWCRPSMPGTPPPPPCPTNKGGGGGGGTIGLDWIQTRWPVGMVSVPGNRVRNGSSPFPSHWAGR